MGYGPDFDPPLNSIWQNLGCPVVAYSPNSQKEADLSAVAQSTECAIAQWQTQQGGQILSYVNRQTSANGYCPDGSVFTYGVIGGLFAALTQAQADAAAMSYVQGQLLPLHIVCLSDLPNAALAGQQFSASLTATGSVVGTTAGSNQWNVVAGILPPGLTLLGDYPQAGEATITGIPTITGEYRFLHPNHHTSRGLYGEGLLHADSSIACQKVLWVLLEPHVKRRDAKACPDKSWQLSLF